MTSGTLHPAFAPVAAVFARMFRDPSHGGGSLAVHVDGELVIDIWDGWTGPDGSRPWDRDTVAMCFSTTKGVATTLLHRVLEQHDVRPDERVADHWPEFGQAGKQDMTIGELLSHRGGMHRIRGVLQDPTDLLDHRRMAALLAASPADEGRRGTPGYHAMTFGWLVTGLLEAITGEDPRDTLDRELAQPLDADAMWFGVPQTERERLAPLFPRLDFSDQTIERLARSVGALRPAQGLRDAAMVPGLAGLLFDDERIHETVIGSVNGVFSARALAKLYSALATDGSVDGHQIVSRERLATISRVQTRKRDFVLNLPMRWRLGYHQAFTGLRHRAKRAFGHFGAGGSGGWADPETGVSLAFVTNRMGSTTTPVGDVRLIRLGGAVMKQVRAVA